MGETEVGNNLILHTKIEEFADDNSINCKMKKY